MVARTKSRPTSNGSESSAQGVNLPRVVIAAPASGQGKTTVAVGIMAALTRAGVVVSPGKVGPDYIDPGYHQLATGRPGRNLDPWLVGEERIAQLLVHGASVPTPADLSIVEGVMGLFDGRLGTDGFASTAHVASLTSSPVILVIDTSSTSRTIAATVAGISVLAPELNLAGVILNKVGSPRHTAELSRAVEQAGVPVIGVLARDAGISAPSRHLGLIPVAERAEAASQLDRLAAQVSQFVDLMALRQIAAQAPALAAQAWDPGLKPISGKNPVVAVAAGRAFTFRYAETEELLRLTGCDPVPFDPATDTELPSGTAGLYLGGGFPEMYATPLKSNTRLLSEIREAIGSGLPTVAECAGLLYLSQTVDGHGFVGAVPAEAAMHPRLTMGYRQAEMLTDSILGPAGTVVTGHEFHRTRTNPGHGDQPAWDMEGVWEGFVLDPAGTGMGTLHASYLHTHWAGHPQLAQNFASAVHDFVPQTVDKQPWPAMVGRTAAGASASTRDDFLDDPLDHHGDAEVSDQLANFAVNVRLPGPPPWLARILNEVTGSLGSYPNCDQARKAIADRHRVDPDMVLPTAGAAEAFTLIAQTIKGSATVIHPQFTEPEAALRRAGRKVHQHLLAGPGGLNQLPGRQDPRGYAMRAFTLNAAQVADSDLIVIGNPTNPTGVLHLASEIQRLPARVTVVDEAFMDAIGDDAESLISARMPGLLVVRSLTKTWGLAGVRAGYVVGDPELIAALKRQQTPWSVGSHALAVMVATAKPSAVAEAEEAADTFGLWRSHLVKGLNDLEVRSVASAAPFVLAQPGAGVHTRLRERGFALRRCDTFPGLDQTWVRIALRDPNTTDHLLRELRLILEESHDR